MSKIVRRTLGKPLSAESKRRLKKLAGIPDDKINLGDAPLLPLARWKKAVQNPFTPKKQLTIRLDADVFEWLRGKGRGYQTQLNDMLRQIMLVSRLSGTRRRP